MISTSSRLTNNSHRCPQHDNIINSPSAATAAAAEEDEGIEMNNFKPETNATSSDPSLSSTESAAPSPSPPPRNQVDNDQEQKSCHASGEIRFHRALTFDEAIGKRSGKETLRVILNVISLLIIYLPESYSNFALWCAANFIPLWNKMRNGFISLKQGPFSPSTPPCTASFSRSFSSRSVTNSGPLGKIVIIRRDKRNSNISNIIIHNK